MLVMVVLGGCLLILQLLLMVIYRLLMAQMV